MKGPERIYAAAPTGDGKWSIRLTQSTSVELLAYIFDTEEEAEAAAAEMQRTAETS